VELLNNENICFSAVCRRGGIKKVTIALVYLLPVSCFLFVNNLVSIVKKVHEDNKEIGLNTIGATLGLLLISGAIIVA
jgi:hypothetical protein